MDQDIVLWIVVGTALAFDFTNGFHDTANAVATSISTQALAPRTAVALSAVLNFAGAFISLEVADYLGLYKIEAPMEQAQRQAHILMEACRQISEAMPRLRGFRDVSHFTTEIHRLETDGDRITREAVASLFDTGIDPMVVIRWKDIFERLEDAVDATEQIANILANIVDKNS